MFDNTSKQYRRKAYIKTSKLQRQTHYIKGITKNASDRGIRCLRFFVYWTLCEKFSVQVLLQSMVEVRRLRSELIKFVSNYGCGKTFY